MNQQDRMYVCRNSEVPPNLFILNTSYLIITLHPLWSHFFSFFFTHNCKHVTKFYCYNYGMLLHYFAKFTVGISMLILIIFRPA